MSVSEVLYAFRAGFLPIAIVVVICTLCVYAIARFVSKVKVVNQLTFLTGFGFLGGLLGYSAGASQESIMGTVLPTLLTFITLLLGYIFTKDERSSPVQPIVPHCLLLLMVSSLFCLFLGGIVKRQNQEFQRKYNEYLLRYEKVDLEIEKAKKLRELETGSK